jgi:ferredoxin
MTRIVVDRKVCTGHACCNAASPELYPLDDNGFVEFDEREIPAGARGAAEFGAGACPERAIRLDG